ncbi:MAG: hypothetical protein RLZZ244_2727 [Verrucomicrobiota bacterium]|jgi:hypothetical protein
MKRSGKVVLVITTSVVLNACDNPQRLPPSAGHPSDGPVQGGTQNTSGSTHTSGGGSSGRFFFRGSSPGGGAPDGASHASNGISRGGFGGHGTGGAGA